MWRIGSAFCSCWDKTADIDVAISPSIVSLAFSLACLGAATPVNWLLRRQDGAEDRVFANSRNMKFRGSVKNGEFVFHDEGDDPAKPKYTYRIKRKPTTAEALLGNGVLDDPSGAAAGIEHDNQLHIQAQLCAALNRHVAETPEKWPDKSADYPPANWYAKFWHDHNLHGLSYGFAYDDVWDASASLHHTAPTTATVTIGW
jgi:hypothetical protein